jgi:PAS domain S-box-containing protein
VRAGRQHTKHLRGRPSAAAARRRRAAAASAASGFFRRVFQTAPVAMLVRSTRGRLIDANPACERLLGYTADELRRSPLRALTHPDDLADTVALLQEVIAGTRPHVRMDKRYRRKNGEVIWVRSAVAPVRGADGGIDHLVFFLDEITERKRAEEALRESEARFRQLAENIEDGVWMATADFSEVLYVSPALERMYGVSSADLSKDANANRDFIHPDDRPRVVAQFPTPVEAPVEQRFRVVARDGTTRWLRVRAFPIRDESGRVYRVGGITEDVTDRKRAADALEEARRHAARLVQAVREPLGLLYQALAPDGARAGTTMPDEGFAMRVANLTPRERQVMDFLVAGRSTKAIATALSLSPKTVEAHRGQVMHKLRVQSVADLVRLALTSPRETP